MNNRIIRGAILLARLALITNVILYVAIVSIVLYGIFNPSFLEQWYLQEPFEPGSIKVNFKYSNNATEGTALGSLGTGMLIWLIIRMSVFFVLALIALKKILGILISVKDSRTFFMSNILAFRRLAIIGLIYAVFAFFNIGTIEGEVFFKVSIPFGPLLFSAACWVLSEIFLEGRKLSEDSNSII